MLALLLLLLFPHVAIAAADSDTCKNEGTCSEDGDGYDVNESEMDDFMGTLGKPPPDLPEPPEWWSEEDKQLYREDQERFKSMYEESQQTGGDAKPKKPDSFRKYALDDDDLADYESVPPYESKVLVVKEGKGQSVIELGDVVSVHVKGWTQPSGEQIMDTREDQSRRPKGTNEYDTTKKGLMFEVGSKRMLKGWSVGLLGAKKGEVRRVFVTESSGEGFAGRKEGVARVTPKPKMTPPDALYEIEVLKINRKGNGYTKGIDEELEQERLLDSIIPQFLETQQ